MTTINVQVTSPSVTADATDLQDLVVSNPEVTLDLTITDVVARVGLYKRLYDFFLTSDDVSDGSEEQSTITETGLGLLEVITAHVQDYFAEDYCDRTYIGETIVIA